MIHQTTFGAVALATALLLSFSPAQAWEQTQHQHQSQSQKATANANSHSFASGGSATGGSATSGPSSVGLGVASYAGPSISVPDGLGQAPCGGGIGLGILGGGGASSGGTLWEFEDCKRIRESAALRSIAHELGDMRVERAALAELCQIDRVRKAFGGKCPEGEAPLQGEVRVQARASGPYDWCYTRDAGNARQALECKASGLASGREGR